MIGSVTKAAPLLQSLCLAKYRPPIPFDASPNVPYTLFFWNQPTGFALPPSQVAQELQAGNDVEGLIDLPIKEILGRLMKEFPGAVEKAGVLTAEVESGSFEASWSWQFVKMECHDLPDAARERLCEIMLEFAAPAYDPQLILRHP